MTRLIDFDIPDHGWLPVSLSFEGENGGFEASDVHEHCLAHLVQALLDCADGRAASMQWLLEPALVEFSFSRDGDRARFTARYWSHESDEPFAGTDTALGAWAGPAQELFETFHDALARLEARMPGDPHWPPFPSTLLRDLERRIVDAATAP